MVLILMLPLVWGAFVLYWALRKRMGLAEDAPGREGAQDLVERTNVLIDTMQAEIRRSQDLLKRYEVELEQLRTARFTVWQRLQMVTDRCQQLATAALAARTLLHELERRVGVPETSFASLPTLLDGEAPV